MQNSLRKISNYQFVSVQATSVASRYYFPDLPNLREVITTGIVCYQSGVSPKDRDGFNCSDQILNSYVTFVTGNEEFISKIDLATLFSIAAEGKYHPNGLFSINPTKIDFSKSYVECSGGAPTFPCCWQFGIFYEYPGNFTTTKPKIG